MTQKRFRQRKLPKNHNWQIEISSHINKLFTVVLLHKNVVGQGSYLKSQ